MTYVGAVRAALAGAGDPGRAAQQQAYMKSALPFVGLGAPALKALDPAAAARAPGPPGRGHAAHGCLKHL